MAELMIELHPPAGRSAQDIVVVATTSGNDDPIPAASLLSRQPTWKPEKESHRFWGHWSEDLEHVRHKIDTHPHISVSERHRKEPVEGRASLARFMGEDGKVILRHFNALNVRTMLHLQNDLSELEYELDAVERHLATEWDSDIIHGHSWLSASEKTEHGSWPHAQEQIYSKIATILPRYNELVLQNRQLLELDQPTRREVDAIFRFTYTKPCDNGTRCAHESKCMHPWFSPFESSVWRSNSDEQPLERDLVTLSDEPDDKFTTFTRDVILGFLYKVYLNLRKHTAGSPPEDVEVGRGGMYRDGYLVQGNVIESLAGTVTTLVASVLPIIAIICLYFIQSVLWKLIFTLVWSVLLTAAMHFFTNASREQIFQASIAMAAVQVVFIETSMVQTVHVAGD